MNMGLERIASRVAILFNAPEEKLPWEDPMDLSDGEYHIWEWDMESLCAEARGKECTPDEVEEYIKEMEGEGEYQYRLIFKYKGRFFGADSHDPDSFNPNDIYAIDPSEIRDTAADHFNDLIRKGKSDWDHVGRYLDMIP